jgi:uracil-DNA glycosylase
MTKVQIEKSWKIELDEFFYSSNMVNLRRFLKEQINIGKKIYPPMSKVFNAFNLTPLSNTKVVIVGQDPYHGEGQANGLSFSVKEGIKIPPSLQNIYKELFTDLRITSPQSGNLEEWAHRGVLLINSSLTVEKGKPGSHQGKGWEKFTDEVLSIINRKKNNIVFILWGKKAQEKGKFLSRERHLIIESAHPSPFSAHNGFFSSKPFSKTNDYLNNNNIEPINWQL